MGSCYSQQSQLQTKYALPSEQSSVSDRDSSTAMPHPTESKPESVTAAPGGSTGLRKPYGGRYNNKTTNRNSNEQSSRENDRTALGTMTGVEGEGKKAGIGTRRFGFKASGHKDKAKAKEGNGLAASSDSINSASAVDRERATRSLPASKQSSFKRAYMPRSNTGSWKMIDDMSSAHSSKSGDRLAERKSSQTPTLTLSSQDLSNGNASADSTPVRIFPLIKAPMAIVESMETLSGGSREDGKSKEQTPAPRTTNTSKSATNNTGNGKYTSRLKGPFKKSNASAAKGQGQGSHSNQPKSGDHGSKCVKTTSEHSPPKGNSAVKSNTGPGFLRRGFLRKQKPTQENLPLINKDSPPRNRAAIPKSKTLPEKLMPSPKKDGGDGQDVSGIEEETIVVVKQETSTKTPSASFDALDTISIGSIHSGDFMLDVDLEEYEELGQPPTVLPSAGHSKPTRTRSRSRSGSRSKPHENVERRLSTGTPDKIKENRVSGHKTGESTTHGTHVEPIQELANLVEDSQMTTTTAQRRQQRLQRATRPASFPGPRSSISADPTLHGGAMILRPPRQMSVHADDEVITIDSHTYRHMQQDLTSFKTLLLKLRRQMQEDEFHGQSWKNGFKLGGSQPNSPYEESNKIVNFAASLDQEGGIQNGASVEDVTRENTELKQQLHSLHHQVEEQERTIKLLQQQMTKYECGYSEPGGKAYCHVTTQTDKQTSGFYKAGSYRSACVRRTSSTSSQPAPTRHSNRTEFRTKSKSSITDEVFMDNESCEIDDDLDLLMEEVSLGSACYSSVDDNFSYGGSFRATSTASSVPSYRETVLSNHERENSLSRRDRTSRLSDRARENSLSQYGRESSLSQHGRESSLSQHGRESSVSQHGRESSFSQHGRESSLSQHGKESSLSQHGRESSLSQHGRESSLSQHGRESSLSQHGRVNSMSECGRDSSLSNDRTGSFSRDEKSSLGGQGSNSSHQWRPTSLNLANSEVNASINAEENNHEKLCTSHEDKENIYLHISEVDLHSCEPHSPSVDRIKQNGLGINDTSKSEEKDVRNLSQSSPSNSVNHTSHTVKNNTSVSFNASKCQEDMPDSKIELSSFKENIRAKSPETPPQSRVSFSSQSPGDQRCSPYSRHDSTSSPRNHSFSSPVHSLHSDSLSIGDQLPSHSPGGHRLQSHSPGGDQSHSSGEDRLQSHSTGCDRVPSHSPDGRTSSLHDIGGSIRAQRPSSMSRDDKSELDNLRNETQPSPQKSNENNNVISVKPEQLSVKSPCTSEINNSKKPHVLSKQAHCESNESMEVVVKGQESRKLTKGASLPSGIPNLSNVKPDRPSRLPPPRPSYLPVKPISLEHSHKEQVTQSELPVKPSAKSLSDRTPPRDCKADSEQRKSTHDGPGSKKRRQLPSLASVHVEHPGEPKSVHVPPQGSRLPRGPSASKLSMPRAGTHSLYSADPTSRRNTRGKAK